MTAGADVRTTTAGVVTSHSNDYRLGSRSKPSDYRGGSRFTLRTLLSLLSMGNTGPTASGTQVLHVPVHTWGWWTWQ